ncbi:34K [Bat adenovirus 2]|uniref:34K n=2 Tax=Mastadenovirus TaxID=10509 RepID=G1FQN9_9ADEN|nr:34K [Bat adenovirus 2]AEM06286.1 34K [Bat adenovirus 2]QRV11598.1 34K [Bat mastadenovirus]
MQCVPAGGDSPSHATVVVRAPNYWNCFAFCYEVPILWNEILNTHDKILLGNFVCCGGLELILTRHCCVSEPQCWRLHCHCSDSRQLQCLAGREVLRQLVLKILAGGVINRYHLWIRESINAGHPEEIVYVGSIIFDGIHYLYFTLTFNISLIQWAIEEIAKHLNPDMGFIVRGKFNFWMVLKCRSCSVHNVTALKCCALRARKFVAKLLNALKSTVYLYVHWSTSKHEERRQKALRQAMLYNRCRHMSDLALVNLSAFLHF